MPINANKCRERQYVVEVDRISDPKAVSGRGKATHAAEPHGWQIDDGQEHLVEKLD